MSKDLFFILGPTATGKSAIAMHVAQALDGEIIHVDSMAVYRGMDIGTAKPDAAMRKKVPHHLIDVCDPKHDYSVAEFCEGAKSAIAAICQKGRTPILCGGTMFYFHALEHGLSPLPPKDLALREQIQQRLEDKGVLALHEWLEELDEESARRIHPNDSQRLQRAIEICLLSGKPLTEMEPQQALAFDGKIHRIALHTSERDALRERIESRFLQMLKEGMVDELAHLLCTGQIDANCNAMRAVGYRQAWQYLSGQISRDVMQEKAIHATCQLAKRQLTWMRRMDLNYYCVDTMPQQDICARIVEMAAKE